ncbi:hypothetical protein Vi05172_g4228 [Venturia inaequalis]|nr:hypothetical protein Vi05172_g4228 [Venturia inaequalis]
MVSVDNYNKARAKYPEYEHRLPRRAVSTLESPY